MIRSADIKLDGLTVILLLAKTIQERMRLVS